MKHYTEGQLVKDLKGRRSLRDLAEYFNEDIPDGIPGRITWMSVWYWIKGMHPVTGSSLWAWRKYYSAGDPRHDLAEKILKQRAGANNEEDYRKIIGEI